MLSSYLAWSTAAGIAGNVSAFVLYLSPIPTFKRIIKNKSTEDFSGLPYTYGLLNCLICVWYALPIVQSGIILVATINSIGSIFQLVYLIIFIVYAERALRLRMIGLLTAVVVVFSSIVAVSLIFLEGDTRATFVGCLCVASVISMYASPLFIINLVIKTRSVEFMPFTLSFATFLVSFSFAIYGAMQDDAYVYFPNGIGAILGLVQLALYWYYSNAKPLTSAAEESREPLLVSDVP